MKLHCKFYGVGLLTSSQIVVLQGLSAIRRQKTGTNQCQAQLEVAANQYIVGQQLTIEQHGHARQQHTTRHETLFQDNISSDRSMCSQQGAKSLYLAQLHMQTRS